MLFQSLNQTEINNKMRPTIAYIDSSALTNNFNLIKNAVGDKVKVISVVKANAYGHGAVQVSGILEKAGTDFFAVAISEEGVQLRVAGIKKPILLLGGIFPEQINEIINNDLIPVVYDMENLNTLSKAAVKMKKKIRFHLKVDTGMGRLGLKVGDALKLLEKIGDFKGLKMEGILSHFATSDGPDFEYVKYQFKKFNEVTKKTKDNYILKHMANSAAIFLNKDFHFNAVRPGISLYGINPFDGKKYLPLKPVMTLKTKILSIKHLNKGESVSYGRTYRAPRKIKAAVIPIGYGDGYHRLLSNKGEVIVKGNKLPLIGIVCMDLLMVDVTMLKDAEVGDEVVLIGKSGDKEITATELAKKAGTIPYEIFTSVNSRVPREFL